MAMRIAVLVVIAVGAAAADDAKPLPVRRSVIMPSGGTYFVEGRKEIRWGQELSVQKGTKIVGKGEGATLVVSGALQVRGIKDTDVIFEDLVIEVAERCERVHFETVKMNRCVIRTPKDKASEAHIHLEETVLHETPVDLRLCKGEVTLLNSRTKSSFKLVGAPTPGTKTTVKALLNTSNIDRELQVEGITDLTVRACLIVGKDVRFLDCAKFSFDGNITKSPSIVFEQSKAGRFKNTKVGKCDFHDTVLVFKAPRDGKKKDKIPVDKCWFGGLTKKKKILASYIRDGNLDAESGAYVVFRKINKRELKLGGRVIPSNSR